MQDWLRPTPSKIGRKWTDDALCTYEHHDLFFAPADGGELTIDGLSTEEKNYKAKAICNTCPVVDECLQYALETNQPNGIWGGLDEKERYRLRKRKQHHARLVEAV